MLVLLTALASAQTEVCASDMTSAEWSEGMDAADAALAALDGARAAAVLDDLIYELRCLSAPATPALVGRLARQVALVAFFAQDPDELSYWGSLARATAGGAPWPEGVPVPDRFLVMLDELPEPALDRIEGAGLLVPKGGGALLDGWLILEPEATRGTQHLLQIADKRGEVLSTRWQTGSAFPEDVLADEGVELDVPRWYVEPPSPPPAPVPVSVPVPVPGPAPDAAVAAPEPTLTFDGDVKWPDCPWQGIPDEVEATGKLVRVAGVDYPVRSEPDVASFRKVLRSCGEFRAVRRLARWQQARGKPFAGARGFREAMVEALRTAEPVRKKKARKD